MIKDLTWADVNIGKFMKLEMIKSLEITKVEKYIEMVGLFYDIDDPRELTMAEYGKYLAHMEGVQTLPPIATELEVQHVVNGKTFERLIDVNQMTGGQFIDFSVIKNENSLDKTLAVLYRNDEMSHKQRSMWIKEHETVEGAYPYVSFFLRCINKSLQPFLQSLPAGKNKRRRPDHN